MSPIAGDYILTISPHLDDVVFSCGELLAKFPGARVVTVFAGIPQGDLALTEWDALSGFGNGQEAMQCRRREDANALHILDAMPIWLDFFDSQYHATPTLPEIVDMLGNIIAESNAATILFPAGLFHSDHVLVHDAALAVRRQHPQKKWLMYEEPRYRRLPCLLQQRLVTLYKDAICATPEVIDDRLVHHSRKCDALVTAGWHVIYSPQLVAYHYPSSVRDALARERLLIRNGLWTAWMRIPLWGALKETFRIIRRHYRCKLLGAALTDALLGLPWVVKKRKPLPAEILNHYWMVHR